MSGDNDKNHWQHYIGCPRFGGKRVALNCVHLDRYRGCRKWCPSLAAHIKANPDFMDTARAKFEEQGPNQPQKIAYLPAKHSLKGIPNPELVCQTCKFVAKSLRGLNIHKKRQHRFRLSL